MFTLVDMSLQEMASFQNKNLFIESCSETNTFFFTNDEVAYGGNTVTEQNHKKEKSRD